MSCGIYKITNLINGHSYIGQSVNIEQRWSREKYIAFTPTEKGYEMTISEAFRKYGLKNFAFEILEECSISELNEKEQYYIKKYDTYKNGYNSTLGGQTISEFFRKKIPEQIINKVYDLLINSTLSQKEIAELFEISQNTVSNINQGKVYRQDGFDFPLRKNKNICLECGQIISYGAIRCFSCEKERTRKAVRPSKEELKKLLKNSNFTQIGKDFNVSDNTIRRWCIAYHLPSTRKAINSYSEEEWNNL